MKLLYVVNKCVMCVLSHSVMSSFLRPHGLYPTRLLCPRSSPGKNTGVGSYSLLQGISLTQGLNSCLLHCRWIRYCLSHQSVGNVKNEAHWQPPCWCHLLIKSDTILKNSGLPHCRRILYQLSYQGCPIQSSLQTRTIFTY